MIGAAVLAVVDGHDGAVNTARWCRESGIFRVRMARAPSSGLGTRMQIRRAKLPSSVLPEADRSLFLLLGHISNEINVFQKLMLMLRRGDPP
jgi:hypothetical protein